MWLLELARVALVQVGRMLIVLALILQALTQHLLHAASLVNAAVGVVVDAQDRLARVQLEQELREGL